LEPVPAEAPPIPSLADIKEDIVNKGMEATGANEALAKVQNITANPLGAAAGQLPAMPAMPAMPALPTVPALPTAANMPAIPTPSIESAEATVGTVGAPPAPNGATPAPNGAPPAAKRGGSRRRGYKRTKRRHTIKRR